MLQSEPERRTAELVERLRRASKERARGGRAWADYADAADEIERLRAENAALREALRLVMKEASQLCVGGERMEPK